MSLKSFGKKARSSKDVRVERAVEGDKRLVSLLGIEFSLADLAMNARPNWRKRFIKGRKSLNSILFLAVPDAEDIEVLEQQCEILEKSICHNDSGWDFTVISQLAMAETPELSSTNTLARVALAYFFCEYLETAPETGWEYVEAAAKAMEMPINQADQNPLDYFCSAVEVPLVLSATLSGLERGHALGTEAIETFGVLLESFFDAEGWISPKYLSELGPLFAAILRARRLIKLSNHPVPDNVHERFEWIGRQFLRLLDAHGQLSLSSCYIHDPKWLLELVGQLTKDSEDSAIVNFMLQNSAKGKASKRLPDASDFSESAQIGVLRSSWRRKSPRLGVAIVDSEFFLELGAACSLLKGFATPQVSLDKTPFEMGSEPSTLNCWEINDDVSLIELQRQLPANATWQRQLIISRRDDLVLIFDAFLFASTVESIEYRCDWPLADQITPLGETETREVYLQHAEKIVSLALPITLGEWRADRSGQEFTANERSLTFVQTGRGRAMFAGIVFDMNSKRAKRPRTWRKLTVAENLQIVSDDTAVARRFQIDDEQWVVYRNLSHVGNRTFIGQNVFCDFCFERFRKDGSIKMLVEIE